ncbi:hypothetical protein IMSAGC022_00848 [Alistipes sp.]|nr:hypothetical protein [Alistipes sp.]GFI54236.1 hypothetical protein IMSAGC022_00848 [Alistipes sp.]
MNTKIKILFAILTAICLCGCESEDKRYYARFMIFRCHNATDHEVIIEEENLDYGAKIIPAHETRDLVQVWQATNKDYIVGFFSETAIVYDRKYRCPEIIADWSISIRNYLNWQESPDSEPRYKYYEYTFTDEYYRHVVENGEEIDQWHVPGFYQ